MGGVAAKRLEQASWASESSYPPVSSLGHHAGPQQLTTGLTLRALARTCHRGS